MQYILQEGRPLLSVVFMCFLLGVCHACVMHATRFMFVAELQSQRPETQMVDRIPVGQRALAE
jgi:hypothetical protein